MSNNTIKKPEEIAQFFDERASSSIETQTQLLLKADFSNIEVIWQENEAAIFVANAK